MSLKHEPWMQVFTVAGLLLGMTLPAILSNEWRFPKVFATGFTSVHPAFFFFFFITLKPRVEWHKSL